MSTSRRCGHACVAGFIAPRSAHNAQGEEGTGLHTSICRLCNAMDHQALQTCEQPERELHTWSATALTGS